MKKITRQAKSFLFGSFGVAVCLSILASGIGSILQQYAALETTQAIAQSLVIAQLDRTTILKINLVGTEYTGNALAGSVSQLRPLVPALDAQPEFIKGWQLGIGSNVRHTEGWLSLETLVFVRDPITISSAANKDPILSRVSLQFPYYASHIIAIAIITFLLTVIACIGLSWFLRRQSSKFNLQLKNLWDITPQPSPDNSLRTSGELIKLIGQNLAGKETATASLLKQTQNQLHSLFQMLNSMNEGVIMCDSRSRIKLMNPRARELFGLQDIEETELIQAPLLERVRASDLFSLFEEIIANHNPAEMELILYRNPICTLHVSASWIPSSEPSEQGVLFVIADISTLKHLESVRTEFVANVSHELRTPLTSLKGFAETLMDGAIDDPVTAHKYLGIILRQADRLIAIIEDLLMLSRLEQSGAAIPRESCSLNDLIETALEVCQPHAQEKQAIISVNFQDMQIYANRHLVEQAVINLVENAVKYSPDGVQIQINATRLDTPKSWEISIADNGPGIPLRDQERLFERFYRIDKARSRIMGGTGLGLAIVRHIALVHGGTIRLESISGQGSRFTLHLPDFS